MDWPIIGTVSATILVAGALTFEVVVFMQPDPAPIRPLPPLATLIGPEPARVALSESLLPRLNAPIEPDRIPRSQSPPPRLARLIEPERMPPSDSVLPADPEPAVPTAQTASIASASAKARPSGVAYTAPPPLELKPARLTLPDTPPRVEQWRVVVTAAATFYNLGGHVDRAGIVDELASSHLRDALKVHRNFPRLPPDLRTHILTQNISLPRLAPYRGLLGMNDKSLEEEQAIRFVKVVSSR